MSSIEKKRQTQIRVNCALLIALQIIFTRFLAIQLPAIRISFAFVPLALTGILYGPVYGFWVGMVADVLGMILFSTGGYHPGFTLVTALSGMVYGWMLHQKDGEERWNNSKVICRSVIAACIVNLVFEMGLNTLWLTQILSKGYLALLPARAVKQMVMVVVQILMLPIIKNTLAVRLIRLQSHITVNGKKQ